MTEEEFRTVLKLSKTQSWVGEKNDEICELLFNDGVDSEQRSLLIDLISRFEYLNNDKYAECIVFLAEDIISDPNMKDSNTIVVAMAADSSPDSSQKVLYDLKPVFEKNEWRKYKKINLFGSIYKNYKTYPKPVKYKNIVLVDEFMGSGQTALGRVREVRRVFERAGINDIRIKVKVLVATEQGLNYMSECGEEVSSVIVINKGISDHYTHEVGPLKIQKMLDLEGSLQDSFNDELLPHLGYGGTESLYCRDGGNTPNNVFPVFWWPKDEHGKERKRVLIRAMEDA